MKIIDSIKMHNELGESVIWDDLDQSVWWVDIFGRKIFRLKWPSKRLEVFSTQERPCAIGLTSKPGVLIVAFETGIALYNPRMNNSFEWLFRPFALNSGIRFNDGKVDRRGRFWISTMVESTEKIDLSESGLYCITHTGHVTKHLSNFTIGNSIAWSPCSKKMYFSDSHLQTIWQFDFDVGQAKIVNQNVFSKLSGNTFPDGADVDINGHLWCTNWGDSSIKVYNISEDKNLNYPLPVPQPTCLAFGGENLNLLFVTSANYQLSDIELSKYPESGSLLVYQTSNKGLAATRFGMMYE